jgi:hypothetical protein
MQQQLMLSVLTIVFRIGLALQLIAHHSSYRSSSVYRIKNDANNNDHDLISDNPDVQLFW